MKEEGIRGLGSKNESKNLKTRRSLFYVLLLHSHWKCKKSLSICTKIMGAFIRGKMYEKNGAVKFFDDVNMYCNGQFR